MRTLTIPFVLFVASLLAFACATEPDDGLEPEHEARMAAAAIGPDADTLECEDDSDCDPGSVCEPSGPSCGKNQCVQGCHENHDCAPGQTCTAVTCVTCPCPGYCEPAGPVPCTSDADCGPGTVCELEGPGCGPNSYCVPGCHANADCGPGETCNTVQCFTCPCPGICG